MDAITDLEPKPPPLDPVAGEFGKYRLVRKLAAGGMAQLFLATIDGIEGFSKTCVIKRVLPQYANLPDFAEMFVTEAKVAALLHHPNIVQVFDFGRIDDQYYLAMEYIEGTSLNGLMKAAARAGLELGPRLAVHLGIPLCDALGYVQAMRLPTGEPLNLVHRDVTPGNVLISNTAEVKLTDFGVVKTSVSPKSTAAGVLKGKFAYMSPEQARQRPLDHRSDIFSLGVVLYEVATGHRLFKRSTIADMLAAVSNAEVPRPSELRPDFPPEVERILLKALAKDPDDRYPSAREMMADLDAFRVSQHWSSGRRELAGLMNHLFPDSAVEVSLPGGTRTPTPHPLTVPIRASAIKTSAGSAPSGPEISPEIEEHSLPGIEVSEDEGGGSALEVALALGAALVTTATFWWLLLS